MYSAFITPDGGVIQYQKVGSGQAVCFLHGFSLSQETWKHQIEYFSQKYMVITVDMRGFGASSLPTSEYSHHDDLYQLLDFLKVKDVHLVGLSLGGEVAVDFALEHPSSVTSLTLLNSSLGGFQSTVDWNVSARADAIQSAKQRWLAHRVFSYSVNNPSIRFELEGMIQQYSGWHWLHADQRKKLNPPAKERLHEIAHPTLIMVGEHDLPYYHEIATLMQKRIRNAMCIQVPKASHMLHRESERFFHQQLTRFLSAAHHSLRTVK